MTKKEYRAKIDTLITELLRLGAVELEESNDIYRVFQIETIAGPLRIVIDDDSADLRKHNVTFAILCRFDNPEAAAKVLSLKQMYINASGRQIYNDGTSRLSSNSGKWNFISFGLDELIDSFWSELQRFLKEKVQE